MNTIKIETSLVRSYNVFVPICIIVVFHVSNVFIFFIDIGKAYNISAHGGRQRGARGRRRRAAAGAAAALLGVLPRALRPAPGARRRRAPARALRAHAHRRLAARAASRQAPIYTHHSQVFTTYHQRRIYIHIFDYVH